MVMICTRKEFSEAHEGGNVYAFRLCPEIPDSGGHVGENARCLNSKNNAVAAYSPQPPLRALRASVQNLPLGSG